MELKEIDAVTLSRWLKDGKACLFDIREMPEYAAEHIAHARLVPLSCFDPGGFPEDKSKIAVFHCGSGKRTCNAAEKLLGTGFSEVYHLPGGIGAWKAAGLPVVSGH